MGKERRRGSTSFPSLPQIVNTSLLKDDPSLLPYEGDTKKI